MKIRKSPRLQAPDDGNGQGGSGTPAVPAAAPAVAPTAPAATPTAAPAADSHSGAGQWSDSITDAQVKAFAQAKGFKDSGEAVKALQDMETKFAVPEKTEDYQLPVPEGQDGAFAKEAAQWMKDSGVPVQAARQLAGKWNEFQAAQVAAQVAEDTRQVDALKTEWGTNFDANVELGRKAMKQFGVPAEAIDKLAGVAGAASAIRVFSAIGKALGESTLNPGEGGSSPSAPAQDPDAARAARMFPSMRKP